MMWSEMISVPTWRGLGLHLLHQPGALDDVGKARIVFDIGRDGQLAAGLDALDHQRLQHGARGIDGGRISGRARPKDQDTGMTFSHGSLLKRCRMGSSDPLRHGTPVIYSLERFLTAKFEHVSVESPLLL